MKSPNQKKSTAAATTAVQMPCPKCTKRAFDVDGVSNRPLTISLKCPHCGNIVSVKLPMAS